jgi:hypothetical protein
MRNWRKVIETVSCAALLLILLIAAISPSILSAMNGAYQTCLESDIHAFLDGKVNTYKGFDSANTWFF